MQESKDAVQAVFAEQSVYLRHAGLGTYVIRQRMQGTKRLACLSKEFPIGVYVQVNDAVFQVEDAFAQTFKVGKEQRVFVTVFPDALVKACMYEGIAPDHEVHRSHGIKGVGLAVFGCKSF